MHHILSLADFSFERCRNYENYAQRNNIIGFIFNYYRVFPFKYFSIIVWDGKMLFKNCFSRINTISILYIINKWLNLIFFSVWRCVLSPNIWIKSKKWWNKVMKISNKKRATQVAIDTLKHHAYSFSHMWKAQSFFTPCDSELFECLEAKQNTEKRSGKKMFEKSLFSKSNIFFILRRFEVVWKERDAKGTAVGEMATNIGEENRQNRGSE